MSVILNRKGESLSQGLRGFTHSNSKQQLFYTVQLKHGVFPFYIITPFKIGSPYTGVTTS